MVYQTEINQFIKMKNFDEKLNDFVRNLDNKSVFLDDNLDELKRKQSKIALRLKAALKLKSIKQL